MENLMNVYETKTFTETAKGNSYVGRGIVVGKSEDGKKAVAAYFIMGRSVNSRNRVFDKTDDGIIIHAFDPLKLADPSLVIYSPVRAYKNLKIVTNGDQTDTVYDFVKKFDEKGCEDMSLGFELGLNTREFEPDSPNWTPRISAMIDFDGNKDFTYKMNILKSADALGTACNRYNFSYKALNGLGHFIHTYNCDGNPIPTFTGEPERVVIPNDIDEFTKEIWNALDENNKVSLYVSYTDIATGKEEVKILNKNRND